MQELWRLRITS